MDVYGMLCLYWRSQGPELLCTTCLAQSSPGVLSQHQELMPHAAFSLTHQLHLKQGRGDGSWFDEPLFQTWADLFLSEAKQDFPVPLISLVVPGMKELND